MMKIWLTRIGIGFAAIVALATGVALYTDYGPQTLPPEEPVCCATPADPDNPQMPAQPQPAAEELVTWTDPNEQAYSFQIPRGWDVQGGLMRPGGFQTENQLRITSPDRRSNIFSGDVTIPTFMFPVETAMSLGYREGQPVTQGQGRPMIMLRFQDPAQMAAQWLQTNFGQAQITGQRPRQDMAGRMNQIMPVMQGSRAAIAAADVDFKLQDGRVGTVTMMLVGQETPGLGGQWKVDTLYGFAAPPEQAAQVARVLGLILQSTRTNPQWFANESKANARDAQMILQSRQEMAAIQQQTLEQRWAVQDKQQRQRQDVLGGTTRLRDPTTGEIIQAQDNSRYYYRDPNAQQPTVYGTDVNANPDPYGNLRRMDQVGTDIPDQ
jgi:hypothetical protein